MGREQRGGKDRARHRKAAQHAEQQAGREGVQGDVDQVIPRSRVAPHPVLQPERAIEGRVVLLRGAGLEPDPPEAVKGPQARRGHMGIVVPDEAGVHHVLVGRQGDDRQQR
jgi:hypothetical protein